MSRRPNPLLKDFFDKSISFPAIDWETVPPGVNPWDVWEGYDESVEGWVPVWYPIGNPKIGRSYGEFERAFFFNSDLERILKVMNRWPLWGSPKQKKHTAAIALLHLFCEVMGLVAKV
ncbi:hypothetical protein ACFL9U_01450 [Thermodesulfobacteriota bacterium]